MLTEQIVDEKRGGEQWPEQHPPLLHRRAARAIGAVRAPVVVVGGRKHPAMWAAVDETAAVPMLGCQIRLSSYHRHHLKVE
jgi:hypothetical protein